MYLGIEAKSILRFVEISSYCCQCHTIDTTNLTIHEAELFVEELQKAIDEAKHKDKLLKNLAQKPKK